MRPMIVTRPLSHIHLRTVATEIAVMTGTAVMIEIKMAIIVITVAAALRLCLIHPYRILVLLLRIITLLIGIAMSPLTSPTRRVTNPPRLIQIQQSTCPVALTHKVVCSLSRILLWRSLKTWLISSARFCSSGDCCMVASILGSSLTFDPSWP